MSSLRLESLLQTLGTHANTMTDPSVRAWAHELLAQDLKVFSEARKRFLRRPTGKRLHAVRTAARRMRSTFEDLSSVVNVVDLTDLRRTIHASGDARDASVLAGITCAELDDDERTFARAFLNDLRKHERTCTKKTRRRLKHVHVEVE